jgi:hypothetical protein
MFITSVLLRADIACVGVISPMILMRYPAKVNNVLPFNGKAATVKEKDL